MGLASLQVLKALSDVRPTPEQIIAKGLPWGGLQESLLAKRSGKPRVSLAPGCPFEPPSRDDAAVRTSLELRSLTVAL